jgi:PAS domain S-box-containing protein
MSKKNIVNKEFIKFSPDIAFNLINSMQDGVSVLDNNGVHTDVNDAFVQMTGFSREELIGSGLPHIYWPPEESDQLDARFRTMIDGVRGTFELVFRKKSGENFPVLLSPFVVKDEKDHVLGFAATIKDISSLKQVQTAEKAVREAGANARAIMESTTDVMVLLSKEGVILDCNEAHGRRFGTTRKELIGKNVYDLLPKVIGEGRRALINASLENGKPISSEDYREEYWNEFTINPIRNENGVFDRVAVFSRDITQRKKIEENLEQSRAELRAIYDHSPVMLCVVNSGRQILFANQAFTSLTGISEEELKGGHACGVFGCINAKDDVRGCGFGRNCQSCSLRLAMEDTLKTGFSHNDIEHHTTLIKMGIQKEYIFWGATSIIQTNNQRNLLLCLHDITELKNSEKLLIENEIRLKELYATKDKFFSIIAHDLRSPFNGFLGLTQLLTDDITSLSLADLQKIAISLKKSATNLYQLLENLLHWSQIQQETISFRPEILPLNKSLNEGLSMFFESARIKEIELFQDIPEGITVFADNNMLQTVVRNLTSNAVKFTHRDGKVSLSAKQVGQNFIEITVTDTGVGMSKDQLSNLFSTALRKTRRGTDGEPSTGLGLMLCKDFIEKNGGKLSVISEEGVGSSFSFTIPTENKY